MLDRLDEDDIVIDEGTMSYSIYWDYRYEELHTDYWIDEIDVEEQFGTILAITLSIIIKLNLYGKVKN